MSHEADQFDGTLLTSAFDPKRTFECGYHPICNISHRFEFDPLESSHELL
jgi:hypothetical protein